jgi:predicted lipid-binding transport protein (Tim44 family)
MRIIVLVLSLLMLVASANAWAARRMGGGKSFGQQSSHVSKREISNGKSVQAAAPAVAAPTKRPWGAMLGGLAAGLGLAWLAHSLGLGGALSSIMLIILAVVVVFAIIAFFLRKKVQNQNQAYQPFATEAAATIPVSYQSQNVGNDASARPWEQVSIAKDYTAPITGGGSMIGSSLANAQNWGIPSGFDTLSFIASAKENFLALQKAWDKADLNVLRLMLTHEMLVEMQRQIGERSTNEIYQTEVSLLDATLLGIETLPNDYLASIEFTGMNRERPTEIPIPFREIWNLTKPINGQSGWVLAGLQVME